MKSILILGLGLIGGSLAKAIKESELEYRIYAYDPDQLSLENALNDRSIDEAVDEGPVSARLLDQRVPLDGVPFGKPVYQQPRFQQ
mgnify:CR=1 FL=1